MNILEKKKKISKNQQKINSIKKNGKSANEHLTQTAVSGNLNFRGETDILNIRNKDGRTYGKNGKSNGGRRSGV